ncbi:hypothetical protein MesoLj131b_67100 [Mesorhizobium sp. 131-2-5]|uniref:hypothetical protein n=1 Tax=Mesorhizobium sp. 131-2-5 TaxID=2744519 RepID=UPI00192800BE|nr:hypothetical protein MesoLj131b_67100 [Mesorhizobium sp. 131-2-5]
MAVTMGETAADYLNVAFWLVYILTRPLGASFGDLLSQPRQYGGFGLGTIVTSAIFLASIVAIVAYMSVRHEGEELIAVDEEEALGKKPAAAGQRP